MSSGPESWNHNKFQTVISTSYNPTCVTWSLTVESPVALPPRAQNKCVDCASVVCLVESTTCFFRNDIIPIRDWGSREKQKLRKWKLTAVGNEHAFTAPDFPNLIYFSGNAGFPSVALYKNRLWGIYGVRRNADKKRIYLHSINGDIEYLKRINTQLESVFVDWLHNKEVP